MKARTEHWMLLLMILVGAIIGSLLWSLVTPYLPEIFSRAITVGTTGAPLTLDLGVVTFTLGLVLHVNIGSMLGMVIAYITAKRDYYGKRFIEVSSVLMFAVPGTVLGIAYILAFNTGFLVLTGTATILVIVFVFRNMPVAIESGTTTLLQIDNSIEEASTILGAGSGYSFRRISLPMLRNAFFSGLVYSFVKAITAVSAIIFLVSPRWDLVTSKIYTLFDQAKYSQAAAFVTMMVIILLVFIGIFNGLINLLLAPRSRVPKGAGIHEKTEETK